ncbi:MAG: acyl carrier protein [Opitutaceae bacterium]|nr:acyl carrier protein [Verrucomicrobiales bacterium]
MFGRARHMGNVDNNAISQEQALDWLAQAFNEPREKITPETRREDIASWDSLGVLVLMADMDEKFDLVMSDQDMRAMKQIDDILAVLRERGKLKPQ